jgi:thiosulfate/3-mercaptopyruvate sulfurtransferase
VFVTKDDVLAATRRDDVVIVDALQPEAYRGERQDYGRPGHIPGACNVPFTSTVDPGTHRYLPREGLEAAFEQVLARGPSEVITYCGGAVAASSDAFVLNLLGVENVAVYDGSMLEWAADPSLPLVSGGG